ncbi:hypothetical protein B0T22DRAFT_445315 [Podospora appendiculata]|uniref:Uncharacterized protein n=1 Tax=Podospora appendiculata TaxID=314037 RepID=A0AAE1C7N5_9PEZI|nr:hypothetical protein B0T22DRAFT_445315 [Podospora appendiculata]
MMVSNSLARTIFLASTALNLVGAQVYLHNLTDPVPGLTSTCVAVLNQAIACPADLLKLGNGGWETDALAALAVTQEVQPTCRSSARQEAPPRSALHAKKHRRGQLENKLEDPFIVAVLIALAQEQRYQRDLNRAAAELESSNSHSESLRSEPCLPRELYEANAGYEETR